MRQCPRQRLAANGKVLRFAQNDGPTVGEAWRPVEEATGYGTEPDTFNKVTFRPVTTEEIRLEVQLQPEFSGGVLEWRVGE